MTNKELISLPIAQAEALNLYNELISNKLEVKLSEPIDLTGRKCRVVENKNPEWYQELFNQYHNGKKGKKASGCIYRVRIARYLKNLSTGVYRNFLNYERLIDLIRDRLYNGYYIKEEGINVPPQLTKEPWED
jgi:hypothetical protein